MTPPAPYPGLDIEDLESLAALASHQPPIPFAEAYAMLDHGSPKTVAERAYADFQGLPRIDTGESDHLHMVHTACQSDAAWFVTHCQIAVEPSGQRTEGAAAEKPLCPECVAVLRASTVCHLCGTDLA